MPITNSEEVQDPDAFADLCESVKEGILEVISPQLIPAGPSVEGEKVPKVKNRRIMDLLPDKWAAKLQSKRHIVGGKEKVHTFIVGYSGLASIDGNTVGRKGFNLRFVIDSYYEDDTGSDQDNAEKRHAREVHKVAYALFQSRVLRRPGIVHKIVSFNERRGFAKMGDAMTRESLAEVVVELVPVPIPRLSAEP